MSAAANSYPRSALLAVVGTGPGADYLTPRAEALMLSCEDFVGGTAALGLAPKRGRRLVVRGGLDPRLVPSGAGRLFGPAAGSPTSSSLAGVPPFFGAWARVGLRGPAGGALYRALFARSRPGRGGLLSARTRRCRRRRRGSFPGPPRGRDRGRRPGRTGGTPLRRSRRAVVCPRCLACRARTAFGAERRYQAYLP